MQKWFYDCEECFRAISLILIEKEICYITQNAFDEYLEKMKVIFNKKNVDCNFIGKTSFSSFTDFTKELVWFEDNYNIAVLNPKNKKILKECVFNQDICEISRSEECLSIFGATENLKINEENDKNNLNNKQKLLVKSRLEIMRKAEQRKLFSL